MIVLGLLLGTVGQDIYTGTPRFMFGVRELYGGINFVSVAVGMFGVAEILRNLEDEQDPHRHGGEGQEPLADPGGPAPDRRRRCCGRPGSGRPSACCPAAGTCSPPSPPTRSRSASRKHPEEFGHGAIEGVAGPESANNAAAQTSFIPLLTLGLPAHPVMALMVGAFIIQGITPGPNVITEQPALFWGLIASMWVGNVLLVMLNLPLIGLWVRMLTIPYQVLFPAIIVFACHRHVLAGAQPLARLRDRLLRGPGLRPHQMRLRARAAPAGLRPRTRCWRRTSAGR